MSAEVHVAVIGLAGVVLGGGLTIFGAWLQHRQQAKTDRQKLINERAHAAGSNTLNELYALRRHILRAHPNLGTPEYQTWAEVGREMADQVEMAAGLIPRGDEVRRDLGDALTLVVNAMMPPGQRDRTLRSNGSSSYLVNRAIDIVSAFQRDDPLPEPTRGMAIVRRQREGYLMENPPELD